MAAIDVTGFRGANTAANPRLLDNGEARTALSVVFDEDGSLRPLHQPGAAVTVGFGVGAALSNADSKTIYPYTVSGTRYWLEWAGDVDVVPGPIDTDTYQRLYFTGDGVPKMTFNTIFDDSTGKYPRTSRPLGILAPTVKPTVSATLPETVVAGSITSMTTTSLSMIHELKKSEGRNSGLSQSLVNATTTPVALTTMPVGTRMTVSGVVDANNVTVTGVGEASYAAVVDKQDYGLEWSGGDNLWRRRKKAYWNFLVPSGATLAIASHGLQTGDVIQVTAVTSQMAWEFAQLTTTPNTNQYARTATKAATGNIVFSGNCNFIINRDGSTIDPTVPQQNYLIEARAYVYTYVSDLGEEGPPSPASDIVSVVMGDPVTISAFTAPPSDGRVITHRRIYRTNTGSETTELQFVAELALATTSYVDTLGSEELGEVLPSETWEPPPATLSGLVMLPNGSACGFYGKTLCLSEPGFPHAWPPEYQYTVDFDIVGTEIYGTSVLVTTTASPYVFTGVHPRQMSPRRITDQAHACISKRGVVSTPYGVVYPSTEGLMRISESGVENITEKFLTPYQWKQLVGVGGASVYSILCAWHENTLRMFLRNETSASDIGAYAFRFDGGTIKYATVGTASGGTPRYATAAFVDPATGQMFFADGSTLYSNYEDQTIQTNSNTSTWRSKVFSFSEPVNLAYGIVKFRAPTLSGTDCYGAIKAQYLDSAGNVVSGAETERVFVDTLSSATIREHDVMRFSGDARADSVQFTLTLRGPVVVERVQLAEHVDELA